MDPMYIEKKGLQFFLFVLFGKNMDTSSGCNDLQTLSKQKDLCFER
jgi:hypothetical protein